MSDENTEHASTVSQGEESPQPVCGCDAPSCQEPISRGEGTPECGPGCNCGVPSSGGKVKAAICLVALLAVAGIIAYKVFTGKQQDGTNGVVGREAGFTVVPDGSASQGKVEPNKIEGASERSKPVTTENDNGAPPAIGDTRIGKYIESLSELNKVALDQDAVFIFVPANKDASPSKTTRDAVLCAQKTLTSKDIKVGLFTLGTVSPDYTVISSQVQLPVVLVACKGRGTGAVSGEVTETKLLQAFAASSRAGGCCPSGGDSSGCK